MSNYKVAREEVARLMNVDLKELTYVLYKTRLENSYKSFEIPKKNGEPRIIDTPNNKLKWIQKKLGDKLLGIHSAYLHDKNIKPVISHGFEKGKSIITNAWVHRHKKYLLNIDIMDFFPSFHFGRVQGYFHKSKEFNFSKEVSTIIAQLVCYKGKLPQGAPTSPIISNLIFNIIDLYILKLAKNYRLDYTRYADDMSFSTNNKVFIENYLAFIQELKELLEKNGFEINQNKTRLEYYSSRQEVTGLTVNNKINASQKFIKKTRAMANQLYKTNHFQIDGEDGTLNQLEGRFSFINQLDWFNNKLEYQKTKKKASKKFISGLNTREKQYRYFLFYKYFFRPAKPTIVTEGKTDILHIKSALIKYCERYPKLITKIADGKYDFKVYFLSRSKRLNYFFGISSDGADTMKNIWNFYDGKNNCENIYEYMKRKRQSEPSNKANPVALLFDNEQKSNKPLKEFLAYLNIKMEPGVICKHLKANLFLQTIPLVNGLKECEIEDLYQKEVLNIAIKGKKFCKNLEDDSENYFGKHIFSLYVKRHYNEIDFSNFLPILDSINSLV